jgi:Predicted transcriptional regulator
MSVSKIERLIGIIFLLVNKERITAKELAEHFGVSIKTIYRDIETLSLSNIPVTSYAGISGGYGLIKDFVIDKNVLSYSEIVSAVSVLNSISGFFNDPGISIAAEKMKALINNEKKSELEKQAEEIGFDLSAWGDSEPTKVKFNLIRTAIQGHNLITFNYCTRNGDTAERKVEPIKLFFKEAAWYMKGYCMTRADIRNFKLSRIDNLIITEEKFIQEDCKYDLEKKNQNSSKNDKFIKVILKFSKEVRIRMSDYIDATRVYEKEGNLYAEFCYPEEEQLYSMILSFGDKVQVLEPEYLRDIIKQRAKKVYDLYVKEENHE